MSDCVLTESPPIPEGIGLKYGHPLYLAGMGIYEGSNYWDGEIMLQRETGRIKYLKAVFGKDMIFLGYGNKPGGAS